MPLLPAISMPLCPAVCRAGGITWLFAPAPRNGTVQCQSTVPRRDQRRVLMAELHGDETVRHARPPHHDSSVIAKRHLDMMRADVPRASVESLECRGLPKHHYSAAETIEPREGTWAPPGLGSVVRLRCTSRTRR